MTFTSVLLVAHAYHSFERGNRLVVIEVYSKLWYAGCHLEFCQRHSKVAAFIIFSDAAVQLSHGFQNAFNFPKVDHVLWRRAKKYAFFDKTTGMTWVWERDWNMMAPPVVIAKKLLVKVRRFPMSQVIWAKVVLLLQRDEISLQCRHGPEALRDGMAAWPAAGTNRTSRSLSNLHMLFGHVLGLWLCSCVIIIVLLKVGYQGSKSGRLAQNAVTELAQHWLWTDGLHSQD